MNKEAGTQYMNNSEVRPIVCVDLKKNRLRVHKITLHLLDDPDNILLLINPETGVLAIKETIPADYLGLKIRKEMITDGNCYEIYSKELFRALMAIRSDWEHNKSYRIYGECNNLSNVAFFRMKDIVLVEDKPANE